MKYEPVSMVITSYNGHDLLRKYLPDVIKSLEKYQGGGEIVVVNDGSRDGTVEMLASDFPSVKIVALEKNIGFVLATNAGVSEAKHDAMLLLNNDVAPDENFLTPLVERLRSADDIFAVAPKTILPDGTDEAPNLFVNDNGILKQVQPGLHVAADPFDKAVTVVFASGGVSLFRRDKFLQLGRFDALYRPIYFEDADISWRAWKKGLRVIYEPKSRVNHLSHATMSKYFKRDWYDLLHHCNLHLFNMRHLDSHLIEKYLMRVCVIQTEINAYDNGVLRRAFFKALQKLDEVIERRKADEPPIRSTEEILDASANRPIE